MTAMSCVLQNVKHRDHEGEQGCCTICNTVWTTYDAICPGCGNIATWHESANGYGNVTRFVDYFIDCPNCGPLAGR